MVRPGGRAERVAIVPGRHYLSGMTKRLLLDIWSDIACPWCYVGKRRLEAALALFPHKDAVEIVWRSFELDPRSPVAHDPSHPLAARLSSKYGMPLAEADATLARMTQVAAEDGLELHFEKTKPVSTFNAHRVLHLALDRGVQGAMKERLLRAYHSEGETVSDAATLARLGAEVGLEASEVRAVLASDRYADQVRQDEISARQLGVNGVPFFVIGGRYAVSGAQPARALLEVLEKAWAESKDDAPAVSEGDACGPDGCA